MTTTTPEYPDLGTLLANDHGTVSMTVRARSGAEYTGKLAGGDSSYVVLIVWTFAARQAATETTAQIRTGEIESFTHTNRNDPCDCTTSCTCGGDCSCRCAVCIDA